MPFLWKIALQSTKNRKLMMAVKFRTTIDSAEFTTSRIQRKKGIIIYHVKLKTVAPIQKIQLYEVDEILVLDCDNTEQGSIHLNSQLRHRRKKEISVLHVEFKSVAASQFFSNGH